MGLISLALRAFMLTFTDVPTDHWYTWRVKRKYSLVTPTVRILEFNTPQYQISVLDSGAALGRAAIAAENCGGAEEVGCDLFWNVVVARSPRPGRIKNLRKRLLIFVK